MADISQFVSASSLQENQETDFSQVDLNAMTAQEVSERFNINPQDIRTDENGKIISIIDSDGESIFGDSEEEKGNPNASSAAPASSDTTPLNLVIEAAAILGLEGDHVLGEDGQQIPLSKLTIDQQKQTLAYILKEIKDKDPFQNDTERNLITALRSGKTFLDIARDAVKEDTRYLADSLSDLDVYARYARKLDPSASDEDIKEEFNGLSEASRTKRVSSLREQMRKEDTTSSVLVQINEENQRQAIAEFTETNKKLNTYLDSVKELYGFSLNPNLVSDLKSFILSTDHKKDSAFIEAISSEEGVAKAAFLIRYFDGYKKSVDDYVSKLTKQIEELEKEKRELSSQKNDSKSQRAYIPSFGQEREEKKEYNETF